MLQRKPYIVAHLLKYDSFFVAAVHLIFFNIGLSMLNFKKILQMLLWNI